MDMHQAEPSTEEIASSNNTANAHPRISKLLKESALTRDSSATSNTPFICQLMTLHPIPETPHSILNWMRGLVPTNPIAQSSETAFVNPL
jgi:hypothetical protein